MTLWRVIARSNTFWASEHDANDDGEIEIAIDLFRLRPCWEYEYKVYVRLAKKVLFQTAFWRRVCSRTTTTHLLRCLQKQIEFVYHFLGERRFARVVRAPPLPLF